MNSWPIGLGSFHGTRGSLQSASRPKAGRVKARVKAKLKARRRAQPTRRRAETSHPRYPRPTSSIPLVEVLDSFFLGGGGLCHFSLDFLFRRLVWIVIFGKFKVWTCCRPIHWLMHHASEARSMYNVLPTCITTHLHDGLVAATNGVGPGGPRKHETPLRQRMLSFVTAEYSS